MSSTGGLYGSVPTTAIDIPNKGTGGFSNSGMRDAFGRLRVSNPYTSYSYSQEVDVGATVVSDLTTGSGSTAYRTNESALRLSVTSGANGYALNRSRRYVLYQPGKSQFIKVTGTIGTYTSADISKRIGYFDDGDGVFFEFFNDTVYFVRRSSVTGAPVDEFIEIENAGTTFDFTKSHLFWFDLEWLGVGRYRGGIVDPNTNEQIVFHAGVGADSLATVYMRSATLPISYEIESTNSATGAGDQLYMDAICASVDSEGGIDEPGVVLSLDNGSTAFTSAGAGSYCLGVLAKQDAIPWTEVQPLETGVLCTDANIIYNVSLVWNPTFGGTGFSYTNLANSVVKYAWTANSVTVSGGIKLTSNYAISGGNQAARASVESPANIRLGNAADGTPDVVAIVMTQISTGNNDYYPRFTWREAHG